MQANHKKIVKGEIFKLISEKEKENYKKQNGYYKRKNSGNNYKNKGD